MHTRRHALQIGLGAALAPLLVAPARADTVLRIGDQHALARATLEAAGVLKGVPYRIEWSQFPAAAGVLEALNAGALDVGFTGDIPFLFAFAAGAPARAIGGTRSDGRGNAILVPKNSSIHSVHDLKGRKVAVNRGGNGHFLVLAALESEGMHAEDVNFQFMGPVDARSAFAAGAIDAWAVWEPYISISETVDGARIIRTGEGIFPSKTFELAHVDALRTKRRELADFSGRFDKGTSWALSHLDENAAITARLTRVPLDITRRSLDRSRPEPLRIDASVITETQKEADLFHRHGVLNKALDVQGAFDTVGV